MKTWKKLLALLLALTMVFAFVACGGNNDDDNDNDDNKGSSVVEDPKPEETTPPTEPEETVPEVCGEWKSVFDLSGYINEMMAMSIGEDITLPESAINIALTMEFSEDGEFLMAMELDKESFDEYMSQLADSVVDYLVAMVEAEGATQADLEAELGMTMDEYREYMLESLSDSTASSFETEEYEYYYKLEENKIYIAEREDDLEDMDEYFKYTLTDDKMEITKIQGDVEDALEMFELYGMELPWTFEKQ